MAVFDFPFHSLQTKFPESSVLVQFGNNYTFATAPDAPDMRSFVLNFPAMFYLYKRYPDGSFLLDENDKPVLEESTDPADYAYMGDNDVNGPRINMRVLENFYAQHRLHKSFTFHHVVTGDTKVRFKKPLQIPKLRPKGYGALEPFEIELVEVPQ